MYAYFLLLAIMVGCFIGLIRTRKIKTAKELAAADFIDYLLLIILILTGLIETKLYSSITLLFIATGVVIEGVCLVWLYKMSNPHENYH